VFWHLNRSQCLASSTVPWIDGELDCQYPLAFSSSTKKKNTKNHMKNCHHKQHFSMNYIPLLWRICRIDGEWTSSFAFWRILVYMPVWLPFFFTLKVTKRKGIEISKLYNLKNRQHK
jgi:hypothetical protein